MSRLIGLLSLLLAVGLAMPARAGDRHGGKNAPSGEDTPKTDGSSQNLTKACEQSSNIPLLSSAAPPLAPVSPEELVPEDQVIAVEQISKLAFARCNNPGFSVPAKTNCNQALGTVLKDYRDSRKEYRAGHEQICDELKSAVAGCGGQSGAETCVARAYKKAGGDYDTLTANLKTRATELAKMATKLEQSAKDVPTARTAAATSANATATAKKYLAEVDDSKLTTARSTEPAPCLHSGNSGDFCASVLSANETRYYSKMLTDSSAITGNFAAKLNALGEKTVTATNGLGDGDTKDKKSGLLGGMGLDELANLAKVAAAGGALYCAATKSCSQQGGSSATDTNSDISQATASPAGEGSSGPKVSSLGTLSAGSAAPAPGASTGSSQPSPTGSPGRGGGSSSDPSLARFNGNLGAGAAATTASSGSSGGGGLGSSTSPTGSSTATDTNRAPASSGGGDFGVGGGGMPAPSFGGAAGNGFNLGDSKSATPTDNALKNILNGDSPPPADLAGFGGAGTAAASAAPDDPENLFLRIKDAHVRCLKRGCVGMEVGNNI